jgi:ribose transport system ATP-binding protein
MPRLVGRSALRPLTLGAERRQAALLMEQLGARPPIPENTVGQFSGGNQQKIVLAKWMSGKPRLLLLDEPTQGVDAGAKFEVLQMATNAAAAGAVVLMSAGDYEQLAHVCTRVMVIRFGRVQAELAGADISELAIAHLAQGEAVTQIDDQAEREDSAEEMHDDHGMQ